MPFFLFLQILTLYGQQKVEQSGMVFTYQVEGEQLVCTLEAPTNGWVGVGFNKENDIVGSDLLLFNIKEGKASSMDFYVKGFGNPVKDDENGGEHNIKLVKWYEEDSYTKVVFKIPLYPTDKNDFVHKIGKSAWLILAYSVDDDFNHHSRIRKHIPFTIRNL